MFGGLSACRLGKSIASCRKQGLSLVWNLHCSLCRWRHLFRARSRLGGSDPADPVAHHADPNRHRAPPVVLDATVEKSKRRGPYNTQQQTVRPGVVDEIGARPSITRDPVPCFNSPDAMASLMICRWILKYIDLPLRRETLVYEPSWALQVTSGAAPPIRQYAQGQTSSDNLF